MADETLWIIVQERRRQAADAARERHALASRAVDAPSRAGIVGRLRARLSRPQRHTLRPARGASGR